MTNNWIWIRGLARHSGHWYDFETHFRREFPDAQIEMLDARGNGVEAHVPSLLSMADNVRDLRSRSRLAKSGPVHLLTISLGSMIGIEWARLFPKEVASLTCINTSDSKNSKFYDRLRPRNYSRILDSMLHPADHFRSEMNIVQMIAQNLKDKEKVAREFAQTPPTSTANVLRQLFAASQFHLPQHKPAVPLTLMASKGDRFVNPACTERIAKKWNCEIIWHPSAGHDLPLEEPAWVCEQLGLQRRPLER